MDFSGGEGIAGGDVCKPYESVHEGELSWMVELEARNALSRRGDGRLREFSELTTVDEGLQDVLLDIEVIVDDRRKLSAERRKIFDRFVHAVIIDVVAGRLCPQGEVVANVLLDEAVAVMATNNGVGKLHIRDLSLQLTPIALADLATKDHYDLVRLSDRSIGIEQAFAELVQRRTAMKDNVVAELT